MATNILTNPGILKFGRKECPSQYDRMRMPARICAVCIHIHECVRAHPRVCMHVFKCAREFTFVNECVFIGACAYLHVRERVLVSAHAFV